MHYQWEPKEPRLLQLCAQSKALHFNLFITLFWRGLQEVKLTQKENISQLGKTTETSLNQTTFFSLTDVDMLWEFPSSQGAHRLRQPDCWIVKYNTLLECRQAGCDCTAQRAGHKLSSLHSCSQRELPSLDWSSFLAMAFLCHSSES